MSISRTQMGCLLVLILVLLSSSCLNHGALGARYGKKVEHTHKFRVWWKSFSHETARGSYKTVNREVPSSPDPLHNR
ncbi:hypothetical protein AAZX31_20G219600 [Glycine max]|uniref:CLE17 protein n=1 Tax=Glycine max TaxID=3847 RepID=E9L563_SOYBN|nr:CLE17 protein [Glycine max]KAG4908596.1 hypothetical protein JHK86_057080 [Glycine max]KAG4919827.1 hypothetical protein JHK85_058108 [Glycine max]KAG5075910.1 hypothetical protein JHK84_057141 [Glycine max]KAG5078563.1 hypothetical protein JHK82_057258 [Glycine max]